MFVVLTLSTRPYTFGAVASIDSTRSVATMLYRKIIVCELPGINPQQYSDKFDPNDTFDPKLQVEGVATPIIFALIV